MAPEINSDKSKQEDNEAVRNEGEVTYIVHALAGYSNPQTMKVSGLLKRQPVTVLIDIGNTNNFLDDGIAHQLSILVECCEQFEVKLVDGGTLTCKSKSSKVKLIV